MDVYFDGSYARSCQPIKGGSKLEKNSAYFSWGIILDGNDYVEMNGVRKVSGTIGVGSHELIAFIETALYLSSHGYKPENITFITDDELTAYGPKATFANGYSRTSMNDALEKRLNLLVQQGLYQQSSIDLARPFLNSVFHKVKGHSFCVLNNRCDYLAKKAFRLKYLVGTKPIEDFMTWAISSFTIFDKVQNKNIIANVPFVTTLDLITS